MKSKMNEMHRETKKNMTDMKDLLMKFMVSARNTNGTFTPKTTNQLSLPTPSSPGPIPPTSKEFADVSPQSSAKENTSSGMVSQQVCTTTCFEVNFTHIR